MGCPPDTDTKRLSRYYLYRRVRHLWHADRPQGAYIVLAGSEASEIGCLRDYLMVKPEDAWFVDQDSTGLSIVKEKWSEANRFHGKLKDALKVIKGDIAFINLDFCGYMTKDVADSVAAACGRIVPQGIVGYTFVRDRESFLTPNWAKIKAVVRKIVAMDPNLKGFDESAEEWTWPDIIRFLGYTELLRQQLGQAYVRIYGMRYGGTGRNMGVIALQNAPSGVQTVQWKKRILTFMSAMEKSGFVANYDLRIKLREAAMDLTDHYSVKEVAAILHLPVPTLSAWQAHKTRGSYKKDL